MAERGGRRFSQAISEGDGISVLAEVDGSGAARDATEAGAEGVVVRGHAGDLRNATELPILWLGEGSVDDAAGAGADAFVLVAELGDEEGERLDAAIARANELGLDFVVSVTSDEELLGVIELHEPEIFLLRGGFEGALELLPDVPVGKLAIAWAESLTRDQVLELERAGVDAVIVPAPDVAALVGDVPRA